METVTIPRDLAMSILNLLAELPAGRVMPLFLPLGEILHAPKSTDEPV